MTTVEPTVLSLFSGAGGMDIGLEYAGFRNVGSIEIEEIPRRTLRANRPEWPLLGSGDVVDLAGHLQPADLDLELGELDLIAGGPPCQPFSTAAQWADNGRRGMLDERAQTVTATLKLIENFLPKVILMENVLGFVRGAGAALDYFKRELRAISRRQGVRYSVSWDLVNAADYGVPQNRRRVIIVVTRDELVWGLPPRTHEDSPRTAWDAIHDLKESDLPEPRGKWASLLPSIPEGSNYQWLTSKGGGAEMFGYRTKYWNFLLKLSRDQPSWTLSASPGPSTGPFHWDNRPLSVREQLRLQSFPDDWFLEGDFRAQTKQAGNATPALLAEVMGAQINRMLSGKQVSVTPTLLIPSAGQSPEPSEVASVPIRFNPLQGPKAAHAGEGRGPSAARRAAQAEPRIRA